MSEKEENVHFFLHEECKGEKNESEVIPMGRVRLCN